MNKIAQPQLSDEAKISLYLHYTRIPNTGFHPDYVRKRIGLEMIGCTDEEIEDLCRPKEVDREQVMANVMAAQKQSLRELAKSWPKKRRAKSEATRPILAEVEIHVSGVDLPDQYRAFCAGLEAEKLKQKPILEVERTSDPNLKDILKDGPAKLF
jgi:hypothetical protein